MQPWSGVVIQRHGSVGKSRKKSFLVRNSYDDKQKAPEKTERADRLILSLLVDSVRRKLIQLFFSNLQSINLLEETILLNHLLSWQSVTLSRTFRRPQGTRVEQSAEKYDWSQKVLKVEEETWASP